MTRAQYLAAMKVDEGISFIASGSASWGGSVRSAGGGDRLRGCALRSARDLQDARPPEADRRRQHKRFRPGMGTSAGARLCLITWAFLSFLLAGAAVLPARAQPPAHCNPADTNEIWCANMVVGFDDPDYGFIDHVTGSVTPNLFTYNGVSHAPVYLNYNDSGLFFVTDEYDDSFASGFKLILGSDEFSLDGTWDEGKGEYVVSGSDHGLSWSVGATIQVKLVLVPAAPVSNKPVVANTISDQTAIVGTAFSFQFADNVFASAKSGPLTYSATQYDGTALPSWLSFAADTRTFSGTPQSSDAGRVPVKVRATDEDGRSASDTFDLVVSSKPSLSGTARVGQTLTAVTGSSGSFTYQWIRVDGMSDTNISGETSSTYTLAAGDLGKKVKVKVSFTVNSVNMELTSDAYPPHATIQPTTSGTTDLAGRRQVWEGTLTVGAHVAGLRTEVAGYGWSSQTGGLPQVDDDIGLGTNSYRIGRFVLLYAQSGDLVDLLAPPPGSLVFTLIGSDDRRDSNEATAELTTAEKAALRLHVGSRTFDFSAANLLHSGSYEWQSTNLVWAEGESIPLKLSVPMSFMQGAADPPTVDGTPGVSGAGSDGTWSEGESVGVTVTFSEAVDVDASGGTPSIGIGLGGPAATRGAAYASGSGTTELVFGYTLVEGDGSHTAMVVTPNSLALGGGTIRSVATDFDAELAHNGALVQGSSARDIGPTAEFQNLPTSHDGAAAFKVGLRFSGAPAGLNARRDAASVLEVTGGSVTGARETSKGANPGWEVTVAPDGMGDVTIRVPVRACSQANAVCIGRRALAEDAEATVPGPAMTASFTQAPTAHDGAGGFDLRLEFSHEPAAGFSYRTVQGALFDITGGAITRVWRHEGGKNRLWEITITPDGDGAVTLAARATTDCAAPHAVCDAGGRKFAGGLTVTIPGPEPSGQAQVGDPITASWSRKPDEHDGASQFDLHLDFSRAPVNNFSYLAIAGGVVSVQGGRINRVWRRMRGQNDQWGVQVTPSGTDGVTVSVNGTTDCAAQHAVCAADGGMLEGGAQAVISGPAALSVANARVEEERGATLDFVISLSRSRNEATTVEYATSDGTARAGEDYTATADTLTFAANETSRTVSVTVLDDAHDEGEETLTLRLSNPSGARVAGGEATGTIENTDPLPSALLARFGRAAAVHVVEHVEERLEAMREPGFRGRFAGRELRRGMERDFALNFVSQLGGMAGVGGMGSVGTPGFAGAMTGTMGATGLGSSGVGAVASPMGAAAGPAGGFFNGGGLLQMGLGGSLSFWSRGAQSQFYGREGELSLDGRVRTAMAGADYATGPLVAGLSLSHSRGRGGYEGVDIGDVTSSVTGLYPWLGYQATDRISLWGVTGYGKGSLTLTPGAGAALQSGLSMAMTAGGLRGELVDSVVGGFGLALKADALWVGTGIKGVDGPEGRLAATDATVTRFRTGLEASRDYTFQRGLLLQPSLGVGLRRDGGDAETGAGVDVGGGLIVSDRLTGLSADIRVRMLLAHQDEEFSERGLSVSFSFDPTPTTPLGFLAKVTPSWGGQAAGGTQALWGQETMVRMPHGVVASGSRLEAELGYGLPVGSRLVGTPRFGIGTSEYGRNYRLGYGLTLFERGAMSFEMGIDGARSESRGYGDTGNGVQGRLTARW